jgi:hypothetical protein
LSEEAAYPARPRRARETRLSLHQVTEAVLAGDQPAALRSD